MQTSGGTAGTCQFLGYHISRSMVIMYIQPPASAVNELELQGASRQKQNNKSFK